MSSGAVVGWVARAAWVVVGVLGWSAVDGAAAVAAGVGWLIGVAALAVPGVLPLTAARAVVPLAVPALAVAWATGSPTADTAGALTAAFVACVAVGSGEFGLAWVQASAYGDEQRFALRPPPAFLLAAAVAWLLAAAGLIGGVAAIADDRWWVGVPAVVLGAAVAAFAAPRWYRLARRWLVVVPAGVVIHDHLVLAETVMIPRANLAEAGLARAGTEAADLTGPAPGHPVELRLHEAVTAILAGTPRRPRGTAIHLTACLVAPTRPGRALLALAG